jgi:hypothetical protein
MPDSALPSCPPNLYAQALSTKPRRRLHTDERQSYSEARCCFLSCGASSHHKNEELCHEAHKDSQTWIWGHSNEQQPDLQQYRCSIKYGYVEISVSFLHAVRTGLHLQLHFAGSVIIQPDSTHAQDTSKDSCSALLPLLSVLHCPGCPVQPSKEHIATQAMLSEAYRCKRVLRCFQCQLWLKRTPFAIRANVGMLRRERSRRFSAACTTSRGTGAVSNASLEVNWLRILPSEASAKAA